MSNGFHFRVNDVNSVQCGETYTGPEILPNYFRAKEKFDYGGNNIFHYFAGANVSVEQMKDVDDVREDLKIISNEMTHFIFQIHNWTDPVTTALIQRLFCRTVLDVLNRETHQDRKKLFIDKKLYLDGNDICLQWDKNYPETHGFSNERYKLSVSITYPTQNVSMIHFAYNNLSNSAPAGVKIIGLKDLGLYERKTIIASDILHQFQTEFADIVSDAYKSAGR